jgi:hypothetical protein
MAAFISKLSRRTLLLLLFYHLKLAKLHLKLAKLHLKLAKLVVI